MKKRFTEEQIIKILKEHEGGKRAVDIVREHGISEQTFYRWKSKFGVWMSARPNGSDNWKKKTEDSKRWSPTSLSTIRF
jgi:transposase-like protein